MPRAYGAGVAAVLGAVLLVGCGAGASDSPVESDATGEPSATEVVDTSETDDCVNGEIAGESALLRDGQAMLRGASVIASRDGLDDITSGETSPIAEVEVNPRVVLLVAERTDKSAFGHDGATESISVRQQHFDDSGSVTCTDLEIESFRQVSDSLALSNSDVDTESGRADIEDTEVEVWAIELAESEHTREASMKMISAPDYFDGVLLWDPVARSFPNISSREDSTPFVSEARWIRLSEAYWDSE